MILNIPFPQMLNMIITARAINARNQLVEALLMAEPARLRPIQMMTGPVTTGGRNLITRLYAHQTNDQSKHQIHQTGYNHTTAGVCSFVINTHGCIHTGVQVVLLLKIPLRKAKDEPKKCRNLEPGAHME